MLGSPSGPRCHWFTGKMIVQGCALNALCFVLLFLPGMAIHSTLGERNLRTSLAIKPLELESVFLIYLIIH